MNKITYITAAVCVALSFASCDQEVDINLENHSHDGKLLLAWTFPTSTAEVPTNDSIVTLAARPENLLKQAFVVQRPANNNFQSVVKHLPLESGQNEKWAVNTPSKGSYNLLTFNGYGNRYTVDIQDFVDATHNFFDNVKLCVVPHKKNESNLFTAYLDFADCNPGTDYMLPNPTNIYYAEASNVTVKEGTERRYRFKAESFKYVTQDFLINFKIEKKTTNELRIEKVRGELSGIPCEINIKTHEVNTDKTYRTLFTVNNFSDSFENKEPIQLSVCLPVPGVVCPANDTDLTGPGILQIQINTIDKKGNKRVMRAAVNMHRMLTSSPSIKNGKLNGAKRTITYNTALRINDEKVVERGSWKRIDLN